MLYRAERITHTYPFCWRCDTPLLYYALNSWFIRTTAVRDRLMEHNRSVRWQPAHIRDGRMGNWLENLVDWNLSRSRYWGTPLPIWVCEQCDARHCIGSAADIGLSVADDLHKPYIDSVTMPCVQCGGTMRRVPDVIDCWYDSGAMPFAQRHYPFENKELFERTHPADFISEGLDQTRGWFFSLLAESTLLFDQPAYRNCVVVGVIVDAGGKKMSKSRGNVVDPASIFNEFGADAARWFFYSAGAEAAELRVSSDAFRDVVRLFMLTLWNTYRFFITLAEIDGYDPGATLLAGRPSLPALDRWCLARLAQTIDAVREAMDRYEASPAVRAIESFVEDLSKWYLQRSRDRFWKGSGDGPAPDSANATLHTALVTVAGLLAPFAPFLAERLYRNLRGFEGDLPPQGVPDSVHLTDFPAAPEAWRDPELITAMERLRRLVELGLAARSEAKIKVQQPLRSATIHADSGLDPELAEIFRAATNVKSVQYAPAAGEHETVLLDTEITDALRLEGMAREISRKVNDLRKQAELQVNDRIRLLVDADGDVSRAVNAHREWLMGETLATIIEHGRSEAIAQWEGRIREVPCWLGIAR